MKVSIVINTLDRADHLRNALSALRYQRFEDFEVVVVNGPSTDHTEAVLAQHLDVRVEHCSEKNLAKSRNIGIAAARGDIVAFLDDDAIAKPAWLERLLNGYTHARIGCVGGFIRDHTGIDYQCKITVCDRFGDSMAYDVDAVPKLPDGNRPARFLSPTGANVSYRREALLDINGFDPVFAYFLDETDINIRLRAKGWEVRYTSGAEVLHKYAPSAQRNTKRIPQTLHFPARSKAYFVHRQAADHGKAVIERHLAAYEKELHFHNRALLHSGKIDQTHHDRLNADIAQGLKEGTALAADPDQGPNLVVDKPRAGFRTFSVLKPAHERMRFVFVSQQYPPGNCGGIGVWTHEIAKGLAARGHEVNVIAASDMRDTLDLEDGVFVSRVTPKPPDGDPAAKALADLPDAIAARAWAVFLETRRIKWEHGVDLVSFPIWDLEGIAVHQTGLAATLLSLHTSYALAEAFKPRWQNDARHRAALFDPMVRAEKSLLQSAIPKLANSWQLIADYGQAYGLDQLPGDVQVTPHGLSDLAGTHDISADPPGEMIEALFVGRLERRKGADILLAVLPELLKKHPSFRMRIIGDDVIEEDGKPMSRQFLAAHAEADWLQRVTFEAGLERDDLTKAYANCDFFVAPSRYESFGLIFLEAMMFGKAVIGGDAGGVAEIIKDQETGLLVAPGDAAALTKGIERLIHEPGLRRAMGTAARADFLARYTREKMTDEIEAFYIAMAKAKQVPPV